MFSNPSTDVVMRSSTDHYDRIGAAIRWSQILASASSIFFGFFFDIVVNPPSYFKFFDNVVLLAALYAVTVATAMFLTPVIYHIRSYRHLDVERFVLRTKEPVLIGIIFVMLAMYLGLGLALNSKLPFQVAYSLPSLPFIFIFVDIIFVRRMHD